jgi:hypothetical protein
MKDGKVMIEPEENSNQFPEKVKRKKKKKKEKNAKTNRNRGEEFVKYLL